MKPRYPTDGSNDGRVGASLHFEQNAPGDPYGFHRVMRPQGVMPQAAWQLDNRPQLYDNEVHIDVDVLNIDSASFAQLREAANHDVTRVETAILEIVRERGKMHNPVTGSGGMLLGSVTKLGSRYGDPSRRLNGGPNLAIGDRVATLVSLSLTPLELRAIRHIDMANGQVEVDATAVLFESGIYAKLPDDIPERVALSIFDVCGAPAQTARLVSPGDVVVVLGAGGKSGLTVLRQARLSSGDGTLVAVEYGDEACERVRKLGFADIVLNLNATQPTAVYAAVRDVVGPKLADVVINCVNVPGTEMSSILCSRDRGTVYFFSMATSFTAAALGAEGIGKDVSMVIGNGYCHGHAAHAIQLLRESPNLLEVFIQKFA